MTTIPTPIADPQLRPFGFSQTSTHGYIDGLSGKNPRGQVYYGNGRGALDFITCEVDKGGNDNNMKCMDLGVRNAELNLESRQDMAADRWVRPTMPLTVPDVLTNFNRGTTITTAHMAQFQPLTASLSAVQRNALNTANAQRAQTISKFKTPSYKLPATQMNLIQQRLQTAPAPSQTVPLQTPSKTLPLQTLPQQRQIR
jgi:hypothetical protein